MQNHYTTSDVAELREARQHLALAFHRLVGHFGRSQPHVTAVTAALKQLDAKLARVLAYSPAADIVAAAVDRAAGRA